MFLRLTRLLLIGLLVMAATAVAQVPSTMTVQGRLTDAAGDPLAAGSRTFEFKIYSSESSSIQLWPGLGDPDDIAAVYVDADGFWTAEIGTDTPLPPSAFGNKNTWLEITVSVKGGLSEVLPRIRLDTGPFAFRVGSIDDAEGGSVDGDVTVDGELVVEDTVRVKDPDGNDVVLLIADPAPGAGQIIVHADESGTYSAGIDGSYAETASPYIWLGGASKSIYLYTDVTGNTSVSLGTDAISDAEILDEPGVAFDGRNTGFGLGSDWTGFGSAWITTPSSGYVIAVATFGVSAFHTNGTTTGGAFAITPSLSDVPAGLSVPFTLSHTLPSGNSVFPMSMSNVFRVSYAGDHPFYLVGRDQGGSLLATSPRLTLLFIPTAYGDVDDLTATAAAGDEVREGGLTQAEIDQEKAEAVAFNQARIDNELAEIKAEVDELKRRLAEDNPGTTVSRER